MTSHRPSRPSSSPRPPRSGAVVELDGSASSDPNGNPLAFSWRFVSLPTDSQAVFNDTALINPSFVADVSGDFIVELVVSTGAAVSAPATARITVAPCGGNAPVINAIRSLPSEPATGQTVRFEADVSDTDNEQGCELDQAFRHDWTLVGLPTDSQAELNDEGLASPWIIADVSGTYTVELSVTDSSGLGSGLSTFSVDVSPCGEATPVVTSIQADPSAPNVDDVVSLAAAVDDADNATGCDAAQTFSYAWSLTDAPSSSTAEIQRASLAEPWFVPDAIGDYVIALTVTDSTGRESPSATLTVTAGACGTRAPSIDEMTADPAVPNTGDLVSVTALVSDLDTEEDCGDPVVYSTTCGALPRCPKAARPFFQRWTSRARPSCPTCPVTTR